MNSKEVIARLGFFIFLCTCVDGRRISGANDVRKDEAQAGPRVRLELPPGGRETPEEANAKGEEGKFLESDVDEETISKAEKIADEDLLNGLSRILKNNETLEDVFRAENVYEFP